MPGIIGGHHANGAVSNSKALSEGVAPERATPAESLQTRNSGSSAYSLISASLNTAARAVWSLASYASGSRHNPNRDNSRNAEPGTGHSGDLLQLFERGWEGTPPDKHEHHPTSNISLATDQDQDDALSDAGSITLPLMPVMAASSETAEAGTTHTQSLQQPHLAHTRLYWQSFSQSIGSQVRERLFSQSTGNTQINRALSLPPLLQLTPVNSSRIDCVRNPANELTLSRKQPNGQTTSLHLHGHQTVFSLISESVECAVSAAKSSRLALAQSPDKPAEVQPGAARQSWAPSADAVSGNIAQSRRNPGHEWLLFALQNDRSDLMQFVSRKSHRDGMNGPEVPLLKQLEDALQNGFVQLDEYHTITGIQSQDDGWKDNVGQKSATITIEVEKDGQKSQREVHLTQIAPPFEKRLLKAADLHTVYSITRQRNLNLDQTVMFSYAGMGRNATLAVYEQLMSGIQSGAIKTVAQLEDSIKELVKSGRSIHHQNFVQSDEQMAQIFSAAYAELILKHPQAKQAEEISTASYAEEQRELQQQASPRTSQGGEAMQSAFRAAPFLQMPLPAIVDEFDNDSLASWGPSPRTSERG